VKRPLTKCCNGCAAPVQKPSWVLCKSCLDKINAKFLALLKPPAPTKVTLP